MMNHYPQKKKSDDKCVKLFALFITGFDEKKGVVIQIDGLTVVYFFVSMSRMSSSVFNLEPA